MVPNLWEYNRKIVFYAHAYIALILTREKNGVIVGVQAPEKGLFIHPIIAQKEQAMSKKIPTAEEIAEMKVPELRQHAHREKINLEGRDKKADIQEAILKHHGLAAPEGAETQPADGAPAGGPGENDASKTVQTQGDSDEPDAQGDNEDGNDDIAESTAETAAALDKALGGDGLTIHKTASVGKTEQPLKIEKPLSEDENEELAQKQIKAAEDATGLKQSVTQLPPGGTESPGEYDLDGDDQTLIGSSRQPSDFQLGDGTKVSLGDVVCEAHRRTGLSVEKWNQLPDDAREAQISEVVTDMETKGAGIIQKASTKPKSVKEALEGLLAHEHTVRELLRSHPAAIRGWNDAVNDAKRALAKA